MSQFPEAQQALDKAKLRLLVRHDCVFITTILFNLKLEWCEKTQTAKTNGTRIIINPHFFLELPVEQQMFLLAHECYHVALQHMGRLHDRDHKLWNIATDYIINLMLVDQGMEFIPGGLLDEQYRGMNSDEVYQVLENISDELPDAPDHLEPFEGTPEQQEIQQNQVTDIIMKATIRAKQEQQAGTIPGEVEMFIESLLNPQLPWYQILYNLMHVAKDQQDYTFRRVNRRFLPDVYLPTLYSEGLDQITVAVDISGSITQQEFQGFISEIYSIHHSLQPEKTTVLSFDAYIQNEYDIEDEEDIVGLKFHGGGGTEIRPVFDWCKQHKPNALIVFTDGYFNYQTQYAPDLPIYWVIVQNSSFHHPKGTILHYELPKT